MVTWDKKGTPSRAGAIFVLRENKIFFSGVKQGEEWREEGVIGFITKECGDHAYFLREMKGRRRHNILSNRETKEELGTM